MSPSKSSGNGTSPGGLVEGIHDMTERNLSTISSWVNQKQQAVGSTENIGLAVAINLSMTLLGVGLVLAPWGTVVDVIGVAWAVLNGYPLAGALWGWLS